MQPAPLISAIIPTFNRAEQVCRAIQSVLQQTYSNVEIVVVNDGSTDNTVAALEKFGNKVRVINQRNAGVAAARNRAVSVSQGEIVAFLDSDDEWLPTKLERQVEVMTALGPEFGACFTDCMHVVESHQEISGFEKAGFEPSGPGPLRSPLKHVLAKYPIVYIPTLIVQRSLIAGQSGFDEAMTVSEDTDLIFRLALKTRLCFVAESLVKIDRAASRSGGLMELFSQSDERVYDSRHRMFSKWLQFSLDVETRRNIQSQFRAMLYDSATARMRRLSITGTLQKIYEIHSAGDDYLTIGATLLRRGVGRLYKVVLKS